MRYLVGLVLALALGVMGCGGGGGNGEPPECESAQDCDDNNECTEDTCNSASGSCEFAALAEGSICEAGACEDGDCSAIASIFPCTEQGILDAIESGGGPHAFDCAESTTVTSTRGQIIIDNDVILDGLDLLEVEADGSVLPRRVFVIEEGVRAELRRLTVTGADTAEDGGGIANLGSTTLVRCKVFENSSAGRGGGISSGDQALGLEAELTVIDSVVSDNEANVGGGILSYGTLSIVNTTVSGNSAFTVGGIGNSGTGSISGSAVTGNDAQLGGGIWNEPGILTLTNSTVSGNSAVIGGGILNAGSVTVTNSTLANNTATQEGGAIADEQREGAIVTLSGSLVVGSCSAATLSEGHNIESPGNTCGFDTNKGDLVNVTAEQLNLGLLQDNGGPTMTHALLTEPAVSVAIDAIPAEDCVDADEQPLTEDQRGEPRPETGGTMCDVGAFEVAP